MLEFILRRLFATVLTLLAASLVVFLMLEVLPGDPAQIMLGMDAKPETLARVRADLGLDHPAPQRYVEWIWGLLRFDLGKSYAYSSDVSGLILTRLQVTLPLALLAVSLAVCIGLPLGIFAASRHGRVGDYGVMLFSQLGIATPSFWFGILLLMAFAVGLGLFPASGFPGWSNSFWASVHTLVLPALSLALPESAILARISRSAMLDTLREDYIRTARAKGVGERAVLRRHALRNALIPIVTIIGLFLGFQVAGAIIIESVFNLPGLGKLVYDSISNRDIIVIKNVVILLTTFVLAINLLVDILYVIIDPRPKVAA